MARTRTFGGKKRSVSLKNPKQFDKLKTKGFSASSAAAISNASFAAGHKKKGGKK